MHRRIKRLFFKWFIRLQYALLKPGSHERHKHKHKINTKRKHDLRDKTRIFLCFAFCSALGLCLDCDLMLICLCLWRSLCRRLDFVPLFCLLFYPYAYDIVWTRLKAVFQWCVFFSRTFTYMCSIHVNKRAYVFWALRTCMYRPFS